jgi:hypothetical protein
MHSSRQLEEEVNFIEMTVSSFKNGARDLKTELSENGDDV